MSHNPANLALRFALLSAAARRLCGSENLAPKA